MKNIQIIDGALNCTYSIYAIQDNEFNLLFQNGTDIEFIDDVISRIGESAVNNILSKIWVTPLDKKKVNGIHGTLYYELDYKKKFYPTKKECEMILNLDNFS